MIVVVALMTSLPSGTQMTFAFGAPVVLAWLTHRWRRPEQATVDTTQRHSGMAARDGFTSVPPARRTSDDKAATQMLARYEAHVRRAAEDAVENNTVKAPPPVASRPSLVSERSRTVPEPVSPKSGVSRQVPDAGPQVPKPVRRNRQGWVPKGESVQVSGRDIGGMVYVGTPLLLNSNGFREKCRAFIDPALSVARAGSDVAGGAMSYWPGYSDIPAECRATYLDWLAQGRSDVSYNAGYMFLYFYGLERRFLVDTPEPEEKHDILDEVQRLARLYPHNQSVQRYLREFIQFAQLATFDVEELEPVFDPAGWELPLTLRLAIGARVDRGARLTSAWVLCWFMNHPERSMRTAATRCAPEFAALFHLRFDARFADGLKVTKPRKKLVATYRAASGEFEVQLDTLVDGRPVSDIAGLRKPIEIAQEIADEVTDDLDKFSRYLGRNPEGRGSVEAQALLPPELWSSFPSEALEELKTWATGIVRAGGIVPVGDVIERLEGAQSAKVSKRQLTGAADALARLGFGLAPDPRFALRAPVLGEPVVLFDLGGPVAKLEDVSKAYRAALVELALGTFVIHADGQVAQAERHSLTDRILQTEGLSEHERERLSANLEWMLAVPPDLTLLRRKLKDTDPQQQTALRAALVSAAHADGVVTSEEVAGIEKIYKALGLDPGLVYSDLHAGDVQNGPVQVKAARTGATGEVIPQEKTVAQTLDADRIAAIVSDTARVSTVLGEIFVDDTDDDSRPDTPTSALEGLDQVHTELARSVIAQTHWSEVEFGGLCKALDLMPAGALEALNEWAFKTHDAPLLDEYDGYDVDADIAATLMRDFEMEGRNG